MTKEEMIRRLQALAKEVPSPVLDAKMLSFHELYAICMPDFTSFQRGLISAHDLIKRALDKLSL